MGSVASEKMLYGMGVIVGVIIIFVLFVVCDQKSTDERKEEMVGNQTDIVNACVEDINTKGFDIMYYGEDLRAPSSLIVRRVYGFQHDTVFGPAARKECRGHMIIINDPYGRVVIDNDQIHDLADRVKKDQVIFVYLGTNLASRFDQEGIGAGATSSKSFLVNKKLQSVFDGIADDTAFIPSPLSQTLSEEQIPVYALIMNLSKNSAYARIWD